MAIVKELNPKQNDDFIEIELGQLMSVLKGQESLSKALSMAMSINIEMGYEIITQHDMAVIKQHYRRSMARNIRKEMMKGYMNMKSK